ncbi:DUF2523 domain-containing protein [Lysobacter maris]|uniref:DUF2523 domain-containing protein n=1 Tax=Marilutibacter maris TaxID=1605891 RepID=A0A508B2W9_9GAMM|nr:DUF2523 family protein [Lysobacter maris]KAB8191353.1 DUF2523 domain-containing protein [Lysobacter maris]
MTNIREWLIEFSARLFSVFFQGIGGLVARALGAFGLTIVSVRSLLPDLKSFVLGYVNQLPQGPLDFLSAIGFDIAMTMVLSALTIRMAWKILIVPKSVLPQTGGGA